MDFLININNTSNVQSPSKLIDYTLSKRPIFSMSPHQFNSDIFNEFLSANYNQAIQIDVKNYDILNVVKQFEDIINETQF